MELNNNNNNRNNNKEIPRGIKKKSGKKKKNYDQRILFYIIRVTGNALLIHFKYVYPVCLSCLCYKYIYTSRGEKNTFFFFSV